MNDFLAEIFKKIGSKENTKEVRGKGLGQMGVCFLEKGHEHSRPPLAASCEPGPSRVI